jgi:trk system potassium uptake protein TrkA
MNMIVIGCGRLGSELAYRLFQQGHQVTVVDSNTASFEQLDPKFRGRTVAGDPFSKEVLERAGIAKADGLAAVSNLDSHNAVVAHIARSIYNVPNVIVRNYDPKLRPVLEAFGFQIVSSTSWGAQRMEEMLGGLAIHTVFAAGNGEVEVYELTIPENWRQRKLGEILKKNAECVPVALARAGKAILPNAETVLERGDILNVSSTAKGIAELRACLTETEA